MALANVLWQSLTLKKSVAMNVILPEQGIAKSGQPLPVLYLLHGLSDDYTAWCRKSRIEMYVRDLPLIVVMPDGGRNFYTDNADGPAYATFFSGELIEFVERNFPARRDRAARFVGGLSMGGYGGLRLALGYPELYGSAHSHSGALLAHKFDQNRTVQPPDEHRRIFGEHTAGSNHDLLALAARAKAKGALPSLRIDCGTDDFLIDVNRKVHAALDQVGVAHQYVEYPGAHDWAYWDAHIRAAIDFHLDAMKQA